MRSLLLSDGLDTLLYIAICLACFVIHIYFLVKNPSKIVRKLFVTGYAPASEDEWKTLSSSDILSSGQIRFYGAAYGSES